MDAREMIENFPPNQVLKQVADGKMSMPSDPDKRAIYEAALERYRMRQQAKAANANQNADADTADPQDGAGKFANLSPEKKAELREARATADEKAEELLAMSPEDRYDDLMKMSPMEREVFSRRLDPADRETIMNDLSPKQRETVMAMNRPEAVVTNELMQSKILRATYSERQLEEVMTDFWLNHFNVYINKGADRYLITSYERDVIRRRAFGKFKDRMHQPGKKVVLGKEFKDDGEREGEKALEMLAANPATAHFISTKLAMRFVADDPPKALVDSMAQTFMKTDGDIREVLRTMFNSPEFWAPQSYRAKVKTPFEF